MASRRKFLTQAGTLASAVVTTGLTPAVAAASAQAARPAPERSKGKALRALMEKPGVHAIPEAYSVFTAKLAEANGFEAIYCGGSMMSGMHLGVEDWGLINPAELAEIASKIAREVSIPAIVDADQAGETPLNAYRTVRAYERGGIAGMHIEDTINPKHMGGAANRLQPLEELVARISAAVDGRTNGDFVIIARTDEQNVDEAIRRGVACVKAGADAFMPWGFQNEGIKHIDRIADEVGVPLVIPHYPMSAARKTKGKLNVFAGYVYPAAVTLYDKQIRELQERGDITRDPLPPAKVGQVTGAAAYRKLAERWAKIRK